MKQLDLLDLEEAPAPLSREAQQFVDELRDGVDEERVARVRSKLQAALSCTHDRLLHESKTIVRCTSCGAHMVRAGDDWIDAMTVAKRRLARRRS